MGLNIIASHAVSVNVVNPYELEEPIENDFAYRNNHDQYEKDSAEYYKLVDEYDRVHDDAKIGEFRIGYGGFYWMRRTFGKLVDFIYYEASGDPFNQRLQYPSEDTEENRLLLDFFLHSDCDGTLDQRHIKCLNEVLNRFDDERLDELGHDVLRFKKFVAESIGEDISWEFI